MQLGVKGGTMLFTKLMQCICRVPRYVTNVMVDTSTYGISFFNFADNVLPESNCQLPARREMPVDGGGGLPRAA